VSIFEVKELAAGVNGQRVPYVHHMNKKKRSSAQDGGSRAGPDPI